MLTELQYYCEGNIGGAVMIHYAPVEWFDPADLELLETESLLTNLNPTTGTWLKAPVLPAREQLLEETNKTTDQGDYWDTDIVGFVPRMRHQIVAEFKRMKCHWYLVKLLDRNGETWVAGNGKQGLQFTWKNSTGNTSKRNGYNIRFAGQIGCPAVNIK